MSYEVAAISIAVLVVVIIGIAPVISQIIADHTRSPWTYPQIVEDSYEENEHAVFNDGEVATHEAELNVDIPPFDSSELEVATASVPNDEVWENVSSLLNQEDLDFFTQDVLATEHYEAIKVQYGETVAELITAVPDHALTGTHVMIGTLLTEGEGMALEFDEHKVMLSGSVPFGIQGETIVVKGNMVDDGTFFVQHWEDPEMFDSGLVEMSEWESQIG